RGVGEEKIGKKSQGREGRREEHSLAAAVPKLVAITGERKGSTLELTRPIAIGSNPASHLPPRGAGVSWNHARVWVEGTDVFVEDLGSANGTLVNGGAVQRTRLGPGDVLAVG